MILIGYDGSDNATAAIDHAAETYPGAEATILTVWEPFDVPVMAPARYPELTEHRQQINEALAHGAETLAHEGAARARAAGLVPKELAHAAEHGTAETIMQVADEVDARCIVVGSRGLGAIRRTLLGSVSHVLVNNARQSVLVVPHAVSENG